MEERKALYEIKMKLLSGLITYDEAKAQAKPFINALNERCKQMAKKHGRRFVETTFSQQIR
jgi:hypothetical protein